MGAGVNLLFLSYTIFFFLHSSASCAPPPDQGTESERRRHRLSSRRGLCSLTSDILALNAAVAAPLPDITGGDWISACELAAVPSPPSSFGEFFVLLCSSSFSASVNLSA
jgi:hypothetical protein